MDADRPFIIDASRTPFGRRNGGLSGIRTDDLASVPIVNLVRRIAQLDASQIDDVLLGNTNGAGEENRNVARMAGLLAGLPVSVPGTTVNRLCGSGGEAIVQAGRAIRSGEQRLVIAGGVEGMSRAPFVLQKPVQGFPSTMELHQTAVGWRMPNPSFPSEWTDPLGTCAERTAAGLGIDRNEQDAWALRSHTLAHAGWERGIHDGFVEPLGAVERDESIRPACSMEQLSALASAFTSDGAVTAGNSSPLNDGAVAALLGNREACESLEVEPLGELVASATVGVEPDEFATAPVAAIGKLLARTHMEPSDVAVWEINEAFAAMVLGTLKCLPRIDLNRVNPNGGAIAVGHPLGASFARVVVDLCRELRRSGGGIGVAAACIGVGQGQALMVRV